MQSAGPQVSVGEILSAWFAALGRHASVCLLAGGVLTAGSSMFDLSIGEKAGQLFSSVAGFFVQYHLVEYILGQDFGLRPARRHYASALGAALLGTLGMLGGFVLLVLPGLYLAARWSLSNPLIVGEEYGAVDSLRESWRRTQASAWPILGCFLIVGLLLVVALVGFAGVLFVPAIAGDLGTDTPGSLLESLTGNALGAVFSVILTVLSTALYGLIAKPEGKLDDVFS